MLFTHTVLPSLIKAASKMNIFLGGIFVVILLISGCNTRWEVISIEELEYRQRIRTDQFIYASSMNFNSQFGWDFTAMHMESVNERGRSLVFVRTQEDAVAMGFTLETIIAWPSVYSFAIIDGLNKLDFDAVYMEEPRAILETHGLTLPLTIDDMVDN